MNRLLKFPSHESGTFSPQNNRLSFKLNAGSDEIYNLKDSYLLLNFQADGNGTTNPVNGIGSFQLGNGQVLYLPHCLVRNAQLVSSKAGILESVQNLNNFTTTMATYFNDNEMLDAKRKIGYSMDNSLDGSPFLPLVSQKKSGNVLSTQASRNLMIPLSDLFELGAYEALSAQRLGELEVKLELEQTAPLLTDALALDNSNPYGVFPCDNMADANSTLVTITQTFGSLQNCPIQRGQRVFITYTTAAPNTLFTFATVSDVNITFAAGKVTLTFPNNTVLAAGVKTAVTIRVAGSNSLTDNSPLEKQTRAEVTRPVDDNHIVTTRSYNSFDESPFYVGMPITVARSAAGANIANVNTIITEIVASGNFPNTLILTVANAVAAAASIYCYTTPLPNAAAYPSWKINIASLMLAIEKAPKDIEKMPIVYKQKRVEMYNRPQGSSFQKVWDLLPNCERVMFLNIIGNRLPARETQLSQYRMYWDNVPNTTKAISVDENPAANSFYKSGLYYDRILRAWGASINMLREEYWATATRGNAGYYNTSILTDIVPKSGCRQLLLTEDAVPGQNLEASNLYLVQWVLSEV